MKLRHAAALLLVLVACGRNQRPEPAATQALSPAPPVVAWTWHPVGGLAVIEGEVSEDTELILEGRSIRERRFAELGPVRWEFFRPPTGESAVLRTADGRVLAQFEFSVPTESPKGTRRARSPEPLPAAASQPAPVRIPEPPSPKARIETRLKNLPVTPIPERKPFALPTPMPQGPAPRPSAEALRRPPLQPTPPPEPPPSKTRSEARLKNLPVPPIPERKPFALPAPMPQGLAPKPSAGALRRPPLQPTPPPEPPPSKTRSEARLRNLPVAPIPERKPFALPTPMPEGPAPKPSTGALRRPPLQPTPPPELPPSKTRTDARLRNLPVTPIPDRKSLAMPSAATPAELPRRASTFVPIVVEPVAPRPATPIPPPISLTTPIPLKGTTPTWPGMGEALNLTRGPGGQQRILLSFDGGSSAEVATEVLDLLKGRGVRTTLFLTGAFIQRYPALVRRMAAEGHEIGNHTMNHPHFAPGMKRDPKWTRERVQRELLEADAALVRLLGRPMDPFWRAPYGEHTVEIRRWAEELGYRHVGWSEGADTLDWATAKDRRLYRTGDAIVKRLEQRLGRDGDGLIVLMHLGSARELGDRPTAGLGAFMDRASKEGWSFVSAGTILRDLGKPVWDPHQRLAMLQTR